MAVLDIVLSRDLTLVTGNVRHFERVPGLRIEKTGSSPTENGSAGPRRG